MNKKAKSLIAIFLGIAAIITIFIVAQKMAEAQIPNPDPPPNQVCSSEVTCSGPNHGPGCYTEGKYCLGFYVCNGETYMCSWQDPQ